MLLFFVALFLIGLLGYLAQTNGLCMVRGMNEWLAGNPEFLLSILLSGMWAWVAALTAYYLGLNLHLKSFGPSVWFALGGLLFGIGTAFNQGCGVSTLSKLSRGELPMLATLVGWMVGWSVLAYTQFAPVVKQLAQPSLPTYAILVSMCIGITIWVLMGEVVRKKLWFSMMGIGLIAGFLFLYEPGWTPSGLLHDASEKAFFKNGGSWPEPTRYALFLTLLFGMFFAAWRSKRFDVQVCGLSTWVLHLCAGTLMGVGAAIAIGGNDSQLLLALPALSPAGLLSVLGILVGIYVGIKLRRIIN